MTIFIDNLRINKNPELCDSDIMCHLCTDGDISELHEFASNILNIKDKKWFDDRHDRQHYDIDFNEALIALRNGAEQKLIYKENGKVIIEKSEKDYDFIQNKYGYCCYWIEYDNKSAWIFNLYVHPKYRNKGCAKKLIQYTITEIREMGYTGEIEIEANPRENSITKEKLSSFYKKMGLKVI